MNNVTPLAYTIDQACKASSIGRSSLYEEISAGNLKIVKRGKSTLILRGELERFLNCLPSSKDSTDDDLANEAEEAITRDCQPTARDLETLLVDEKMMLVLALYDLVALNESLVNSKAT